MDWRLIDYEFAYSRQLSIAEEVAAHNLVGKIIFCSHPPVVTLGRKSEREIDIRGWGGQVVEVNRGGRATYHGPSQLVTYPILNMDHPDVQKKRDIRFYLSCLADAWADILRNEFGLDTLAKYYEKQDEHDLTGVWVKAESPRKILSIGIGVKNWCTLHGSALNLFEDALAFSGISPCGFSANVMTSIERELHRTPRSDEIENLKIKFAKRFATGWLLAK